MPTSPGFVSFVLGAVQGLSEFLPISSSAHLVLIPWLLNWEDPGLAFDVALHLGTLLALLIYYWREWLAMATAIVNRNGPDRRLLARLVVASVPGAIIGLLFEKQAETIFRSPLLIALALAALGLVLWLADRAAPQTRTLSEVTYGDALLIGLSQAFAIVPGVSRSGSTITMARILRLKREDAANFSFLMAAPIIAGAGVKEMPRISHALNSAVLIGFLAAAVFGLGAITGLIRFLRVRSYAPFAAYRLLAAAFVIVVFLLRT
jgi:undecaprenyl-diphosphatase